jgi:hypothetical protein
MIAYFDVWGCFMLEEAIPEGFVFEIVLSRHMDYNVLLQHFFAKKFCLLQIFGMLKEVVE